MANGLELILITMINIIIIAMNNISSDKHASPFDEIILEMGFIITISYILNILDKVIRTLKYYLHIILLAKLYYEA